VAKGKEKIIYTVGTSLRDLSEFIQLLKSYSIDTIIDVRRFPTSKLKHFKKENLGKALRAENIAYFYLGRDLGGYRSEGYQAFVENPIFKQALSMVERLALGRAAIMCAEKFAWRCHRRYIGLELEKRGWQVVHIIDEKRAWKPKESEK